MRLKNRSARIRLLGGLQATAYWTDDDVPGRDDGEIEVDPTWRQNNPDESRACRVARADADRAAGRELRWFFITG